MIEVVTVLRAAMFVAAAFVMIMYSEPAIAGIKRGLTGKQPASDESLGFGICCGSLGGMFLAVRKLVELGLLHHREVPPNRADTITLCIGFSLMIAGYFMHGYAKAATMGRERTFTLTAGTLTLIVGGVFAAIAWYIRPV